MQTVQQQRTMGTWPMVEHSFAIAPTPANPFAAPIWAVVQRPSTDELPASRIAVPAFYDGDGTWRIRYRPERLGAHQLVAYMEGDDADSAVAISATAQTEAEFHVDGDPQPGFVRVSKSDTQRFEFDNGEAYFPIGYNVGWETPEGYGEHFRRMSEVGLNWSRVWMAHWSGMNLDWVMGRKIEPGELDLDVARRWDKVVQDAEEHGVQIQLVLQHHGQWSTWVNPNWRENPWNAANGGWLEQPAQFFTDEKARALTRAKYRYIVARWGHSPAIMAWELFNEIEFTDGFVERGLREIWELADRHGHFAPQLETGLEVARDEADADVALAERGVFGKLAETWNEMGSAMVRSLDAGSGHRKVAQWHAEMAAHIRSVDSTGRLITTSSAPRDSDIWREMDFYQVHLYRREMIGAVARVTDGIAAYDRPVFIGEMGDHEILDPAKRDGRYMPSMLWAGLFSGSAGAAQMWSWDTVERHGLLAHFRAMTRFIDEARFGERAYRPVDVRVTGLEGASLIALAMMSPEALVVWLHDRDSIGKTEPAIVSASMELPPQVLGAPAVIRWIDTTLGDVVDDVLLHDGVEASVAVPEFNGSIAAIITPHEGISFPRSD